MLFVGGWGGGDIGKHRHYKERSCDVRMQSAQKENDSHSIRARGWSECADDGGTSRADHK